MEFLPILFAVLTIAAIGVLIGLAIKAVDAEEAAVLAKSLPR